MQDFHIDLSINMVKLNKLFYIVKYKKCYLWNFLYVDQFKLMIHWSDEKWLRMLAYKCY